MREELGIDEDTPTERLVQRVFADPEATKKYLVFAMRLTSREAATIDMNPTTTTVVGDVEHLRNLASITDEEIRVVVRGD